MKKPSIRPRLLIGMTIMIIPLVILAVGSYHYLVGALSGLDEVMEEALEEAIPVGNLQNMLTKAAMTANDYLLTGENQERANFAFIEQEINNSLDRILSLHFGSREELLRLKEAERLWFEASRISNKILALEKPVGSQNGVSDMKILDDTISKATSMIDAMNKAIIVEATEHAEEAHEKLVKLKVLIIATIIGGFIGGGVIAYIIGHSIVIPLYKLQKSVQRFREGNLFEKIDHNYRDEIGELADNFNVMVERLRELTITDELTGLYNRREFNRLIDEEFARARRYNHNLSMLVLDIDHFKKVNDTHGHLAGDEILKGVADRMKTRLRPENKVARFGGEEIVVILPETNLEGAFSAAERIRLAVGETPYFFGHKKISITVSIGVATYPESAKDEEELIANADAAVYRAKNAGRNRTES